MSIKTKRWDDPRDPDDGFRLLVTRYRPRGLPKEQETWDAWQPELGPSKELHAAAYGKAGLKFHWEDYRRRYLAEMRSQPRLFDAILHKTFDGEIYPESMKAVRCFRSTPKFEEVVTRKMSLGSDRVRALPAGT
jgi:uncharacterized protein YeaO (DUF488 family)